MCIFRSMIDYSFVRDEFVTLENSPIRHRGVRVPSSSVTISLEATCEEGNRDA